MIKKVSVVDNIQTSVNAMEGFSVTKGSNSVEIFKIGETVTFRFKRQGGGSDWVTLATDSQKVIDNLKTFVTSQL